MPTTEAMEAKLGELRRLLRECGTVAVAFSGGLDSAFVLKIAYEELGERALAITGLSASYASIERERAEQLAAEWGIVQRFVHTKELSDPRYAENPPDRCYHCKTELFTAMEALCVAEIPGAVLVDGTTMDDLGDYRPGLKAAGERGVRHLLVEAELSKAELRALARERELPIADLPGTACLASRFPYGTTITAAKLARIEAAEAVVRAEGFHTIRVRDHDPVARLELAPWELERLFTEGRAARITTAIKALGFLYVAAELEGYRSGALNAALTVTGPAHG